MDISERFLDELRNRLTLSDVIGKRVRLVRAGREFKACCPFHNEKTPSFYVNDDKQFYHCFGCGAHGDVVGFVMQHDNMSFPDAVESLASLAGMKVPVSTPEEKKRHEKEKSLYSLMEDAASFMETALRDSVNREALQYVTDRGLDENTLSSFRVGYAGSDAQAMRNNLREKGYSDAQMIEVGLLRPSKKGREPYAFFRDRIMFPVPDRRGRIIAFGGRILPDHLRPPDTGDYKPPKYMNSPDTPIFDKGRLLYGEPHARQAAVDGEPLIVVEGYMDVIACHRAGFKGALAPMGTALTEEQILSLWKIAIGEEKRPLLCFDGDDAGRRAASRACKRVLPLLKPGCGVDIVFLPQGEDPDSLVKSSGGDAFRRLLKDSVPMVEYLWAMHASGRDLSTPEGQSGFTSALDGDVQRIADRTVQAFYRQAFKNRVSESFFKKNNYKSKKKFSDHKFPGIRLRKPVFKAQDLSHKILLIAAINHPEIIETVEEDLMSLEIGDKDLRCISEILINTWQESEHIDALELKNTLIDCGYKEILDKLLSSSIYIHAGFVRPEAPLENVLQGWREIMDREKRFGLLQEQKQAGDALASDMSEENESKMMALYDMQKIEDA